MSNRTKIPTQRTEDYLKTIFFLTKRKKFAQTKDISEILGVKPPSVTEMFQKLSEDGYINYKKYSGVNLTEEGKMIAKETEVKQQTLKEFLMILGINEKTAKEEAGEIGHVVSKNTLQRFLHFIEFVQKSKETEGWFDHLEYYFKTGQYIACQPSNKEACPVHSCKHL